MRNQPIEPIVRDFAAKRGLDLDMVSEYVEGVVTGYIDALLWSERCNGTAPSEVCDHLGLRGDAARDCDKPLDYLNYSENDLAETAYLSIRMNVTDFVVSNWDDLFGDNGESMKRMDPQQAGHDFLLTRNHHGAGFWDRGLGERGDRLTANAHPYGETTAYVGDDGLVYV